MLYPRHSGAGDWARDSVVDHNFAVEDQSSRWNLDVETGKIEQDILRNSPTSKLSEKGEGNEWICKGCCGLKGAINRIEQAGGDFPARFSEALRASLGSCAFFSALVFPDPKYLGCIWIGNIFFHSSLKRNVGEALQAATAFAKSIILTTLISWPVAYFLAHTSTHTAQICLPLVAVALSLWIMMCPSLYSPNLMILVMYVIIAAPVRFDWSWWEPLSFVGSYIIGLAMAVFMQLLPLPSRFQPNTATQQVHRLLDRLSKDFFLLFVEARYYTNSTGQSPTLARAAGAAIEVLVSRMSQTILDLKSLLPAVKEEFAWRRKKDYVTRLERWMQFLESIVAELKMLRCALNSRFLGEEETGTSATITTLHIRRVIVSELGENYHVFIDALIHLSIACNRQSDPTSFDVSPCTSGLDPTQLSDSLCKIRIDFGRALKRVVQEVQELQVENGRLSVTTIPIFAHLARRSTSLNSLLCIADSLVDYCNALNTTAPHDDTNQKVVGLHHKVMGWCTSAWYQNRLEKWFDQKWPWKDPQKRRLALKTAVGMMFASFWIAVPQLWKISQPFGLWPGLTVASVNLATTGSSFHKAIDRLVGTLFAAAFALLLVEFFSGDVDGAKIPAITLFTFAVIYLKKDEHAYQYSYAATSIGSMMYGSIKNSYDVKGYIPLRIQLIFVGVITFALVELFLFPRSSRKKVELKILQYFELAGEFFHKARDFSNTMHHSHVEKQLDEVETAIDSEALNSIEVSRSANDHDVSRMFQDLVNAEAALRTTSLSLKTELSSALLEPYFGFAQKLHAQSVTGMVSEMCESQTQALLLVKALKMVADYNVLSKQESESSLQKSWPRAYATILDMAGKQMDAVCQDLLVAFPDSRFRPKDGNTLRAITAAASFRDFRDVRLKITTVWSELFQEYSGNTGIDDPNEFIVMGITTSFILEFCRHLQLAGRKMEWSAGHFPTY